MAISRGFGESGPKMAVNTQQHRFWFYRIHLAMKFRFSTHLILILVTLLSTGWGYCQATTVDSASSFSLRQTASHTLELRVEHLSLAEVLERMAQYPGFRWHGLEMSRTPVSVSCSEADWAALLNCLLAGRYSYLIHQGEGEAGSISDVWLLKSVADVSRSPATPDALGDQRKRARHLARLIADESADSDRVMDHLLAGMRDESPLVRAQAVFGLSQREPEQATWALARGIDDGDASVRLAAVENAGHSIPDESLLRTALTDEDESVRTLAALKLEEMADSEQQAHGF